MKRYILPVLLLLALTAYQNCSDVSFQNTSKLNSQSCTTVLQQTTKNLRIIFMVDDSGSTRDTDPAKHYRAQTLQEFIKDYGAKTNFAYAFGQFASSDATVYKPGTDSFSPSTSEVIGDANDLLNALNIYLSNPIDKDANTPYREAFNVIQEVVTNDITDTDSLPDKPNYAVVFLSDGMPNPKLKHADIIKLVTDLKSAAINNGRLVTVSTVYFGPENSNDDLQAKQNLVDMAKEGDGQFVDTNQSSDLAIDSVVTVPGEICINN